MRGGVHKPTYVSWQMMKNRCLNPKATDYKYYGAKGIHIHPKWMTYNGFLEDMGECPAGATLERKRPHLFYTPDNCCWASRLAQSRNRSYTLTLTYGGHARKVWEWAAILKIKAMTFHVRLWRYRSGTLTEAQLFAPNPRAKQ